MTHTFKQLRYTAAAGRLGSIAAAAAELNISQSSITAAIDAMEDSLGIDLFLRQPAKGILPTPAGREALDMINELLNRYAQFESELDCLSGSPRGMLRLGCYVTVAPHVLPPILRAFRARYPEARIDLREGDMSDMRTWLSSGEIDLAMTYYDSTDKFPLPDDFEFHEMFPARPYAMIATDDPLSRRPVVALKDLAQRPMVLLELAQTREYFTELYRAANVTPNIVHSTRSAEVVRALVSGGFGVSVMNVRSGRESPATSGFVCRPLADNVLIPRFGIAVARGLRRPMMSQVFIQICEALCQEGVFEANTVPLPD